MVYLSWPREGTSLRICQRLLTCTWTNFTMIPRWRCGKKFACQCRRCKRHGFDPWVGKSPSRRKWQPAPVFLPGESHGRRSLVVYHPCGHKELNTNEHTLCLNSKLIIGTCAVSWLLHTPPHNAYTLHCHYLRLCLSPPLNSEPVESGIQVLFILVFLAGPTVDFCEYWMNKKGWMGEWVNQLPRKTNGNPTYCLCRNGSSWHLCIHYPWIKESQSKI